MKDDFTNYKMILNIYTCIYHMHCTCIPCTNEQFGIPGNP